MVVFVVFKPWSRDWCIKSECTFFYWFLLSSTFFSAPLPSPHLPSPMIPMLPIYSGDLVFFYFPSRLDLCKSLLVSSLLSKFSVILICGLVFFVLCLKTTYDWVHVILSFWVWVTSLKMTFSSSIHLPENSRCYYFFCYVVLHCVNIPHFSYPFFSWGAFRLFSGSEHNS